MAQKTVVTITDDIDAAQGIETPADETIAFGYGGKQYEIDLSKENATTLRENLGFYAGYAREVGHTAPRRPRQRNRAHSGDVRAWAQAQGIVLSNRGRIPEAIVAQYEAAH